MTDDPLLLPVTTYFKATRPDGTSFRAGPDGPIDYAAALASGAGFVGMVGR